MAGRDCWECDLLVTSPCDRHDPWLAATETTTIAVEVVMLACADGCCVRPAAAALLGFESGAPHGDWFMLSNPTPN